MVATPPIRVVVVDDHALIREGLLRVLSADPRFDVVGEASTAPEALGLLRTTRPEVVVVDLDLGRGSGLDLIASVRAERLPTRTLVLTMHDDTVHAIRALQGGALGFLSKSSPVEVLLDAVLRVSRGEHALTAEVAAALAATITRARAAPGPFDALSDRESDVLRLMGRGHSTKEIAGIMGLSPKTIESHRLALKEKLRASSLPELMRIAVRFADGTLEDRG
jgi:two-component system invasion response regulator UvrY